MATYDWPSNLEPAACSLVLEPNVREFASPYTGSYEVVDLIGERWRMALELPPMLRATAAAHEAYFNRLRGINTIRALHFDRPEPLGTARGSMTLSATAAQGATSLSITGAVATPNLMTGSSFEIDTDANGRADSWLSYTAGSTGTVTFSRSTTSPPHGSYYQQIEASALGATVSDDAGLQRNIQVSPGQRYTLAASLRLESGAPTVLLELDYLDINNLFIEGGSTAAAASGSWARFSHSSTAPANAATVKVYIYMRSGGGALCRLGVDAVQLEPTATTSTFAGYPTLLAGDMLGCSGQLFQVAADTTLSDAGAGSVPIVNRVRTAISSGTALTWQRPTATFRVAAPPRAWHSGGHVQFGELDLIETW